MELKLNKKTILFGILGILFIGSTILNFIPNPHRQTHTLKTGKTIKVKAKIVQVNTNQSVLNLLGKSFDTVAVKATPTQAIDAQFIGRLSQIMIENGKNTQKGVWVVPRKYNNNLLILSVKSKDLPILQKEISEKWIMVHPSKS